MNGLFQNITHALGWSIVHSLWQGVLIYSFLCLLYVAFPKIRSKNKYLLAFSAQLGVFLAFILTFCHYLDFSSSSDSSNIIFVYAKAPASIFNILESLFPWVASLYVIGLFIQLILFSNSFSKLYYLKTRGLQDAPTVWQESFQNICAKLQLNKSIRFFLSEKVSVPLTLGHVKPIILFPIALVNKLDIKQVESILIHELAHIKRHDYLFNLFKVVIETILFFNPFTWLLSKHIELEREHACDDVVVRWVPSPIAYAQALMSVEISSNDVAPVYAMAATGKNHHLLHRIQRITKMEKKYINVKQHLLAVAFSTAALITIAWIAPTDKAASTADELTETLPTVTENEPDTLSTETTLWQATTIAGDQDSCDSEQKTIAIRVPADTITPVIEPPLPPELDAKIVELSKNAARIDQHFNSAQWKEHIASVEASVKKIEEYYNSPEWKEHIAKIEKNALRVEEYYNNPKWKEQIAKIETNAKKVEEYYNSVEWKNHIAKVEENARKIEDYYNSPEWKDKIAKIEESAKKVEEYYNSPEWKDKIKQIEENAKKMTAYYESAEWKEKIEKQVKEYKTQKDQSK